VSTKLKNLRISEISFVDRGASGDHTDRPRVAFWKRKCQPSKEPEPMILSKEHIAKMFKAIELQKMDMPEGAQALLESIKSALSEEQWALVEMMLANAGEMPTPAAPPPEKMEPKPDADPAPPPPTEEEKAYEKMLTEIKKAAPQLSEHIEVINKRAEAAETEVKKVRDDLAKTAERLEKAEKISASEIQKRRMLKFQKLAETDLAYLKGTPEEVAKNLCDTEDAMEPAQFEKHLAMLKSANVHLKKGGSFGPSGSAGNSDGNGAFSALNAAAAEIRKAHPEISEAKARTMILKGQTPEHREIAKRYAQERYLD